MARLCLFAAFLALDLALLAVIPHVWGLFGSLTPTLLVAMAAFWGLANRNLVLLRDPLPFRWQLLLLHFLSVAIFFLVGFAVLRWHADPLPFSWCLLVAAPLVIGVLLLALACIPARTWLLILRQNCSSALYALAAGFVAGYLREPLQQFWIAPSGSLVRWLQISTYRADWTLLKHLIPNLIGEEAICTIGTPDFLVSIGPQCSGLEGLGLVSAFTIVWLWFFRKENRFPHALLLIPAALGTVYLLNIVRIAVLVLIGAWGYPEVAIVGFHSQAGWIAFTLVALGFSMASQKIAWVRARSANLPCCEQAPAQADALSSQTADNAEATTAYLLPFLAIMGAAFISKALSGYFEWLYPLRFVAALAALWVGRRELRKLDWRFGWLAPVAGAAIFALWLLPSLTAQNSEPSHLGSALAALPAMPRLTWIVIRILAAVVTVPIAEELAFRGFLARRLMARGFDQISFSALRLVPILISSAAFGLMHGAHWFAGILAGLAYAGALRWRGRIGDAVVAHATSNLLLAAWVLILGDWQQW